MPEVASELSKSVHDDAQEMEQSFEELQAEAFKYLKSIFENGSIRNFIPAAQVKEFEEWNASGDY